MSNGQLFKKRYIDDNINYNEFISNTNYYLLNLEINMYLIPIKNNNCNNNKIMFGTLNKKFYKINDLPNDEDMLKIMKNYIYSGISYFFDILDKYILFIYDYDKEEQLCLPLDKNISFYNLNGEQIIIPSK